MHPPRPSGEGGAASAQYTAGAAPREYWRDDLPTALIDACVALGGQFDDLVIDEAQDLTGDYLAALMCTLRDEEDALVWIFLDDNQRVYDVEFDAPKEFAPSTSTSTVATPERFTTRSSRSIAGPSRRSRWGRPAEMWRS